MDEFLDALKQQYNEEDIVKIDKHIVRIHVIKTQERKITSGFARAEVIKRVYGKPVKFNNFDYDLTKYIVICKNDNYFL